MRAPALTGAPQVGPSARSGCSGRPSFSGRSTTRWGGAQPAPARGEQRAHVLAETARTELMQPLPPAAPLAPDASADSCADDAREASTGAAVAQEQPQEAQEAVPRTLRELWAVFLTHPTPVIVLASLTAAATWRAQLPFTPVDALVAAGVAVWWLLQEWLVHAYLLHSPMQWVGRSIHDDHHMKKYYHVSIDSPGLVVSVMALAACVLGAALGAQPAALTATMAYWTMGLMYEWTHYAVHTRYVPKTALGRAVRANHQLHHMHHEGYWLSFMAPAVDKMFGTAPAPKDVPRSELARTANARRGAS